ncbi:MAG: hypothetical protein P4L92_20845 [Rudaea sp.]|nr:hypothetical protein [Rudaea sp.]
MLQRRLRNADTAWVVFLALALAVGIFLRWYQLGSQILLDDEWHAIDKLLHADARDIATHLGLADYSIPLTLYYRFLYLHGGLSEWGMHLPMLLAGVGLLVIAPWLLRRQAGFATLAVWTALLAISPLLVYLSRTARPYAITNLLVFIAVIAFREWWRGREHRLRWAGLYVVSTFLAGWLHLITLPFTLLPFVFFGVAGLRDLAGSGRAAAWQGIGRLFVLGVVVTALLAAALLPSMLNDWGALAAKAGSDAITLESAYRSLLMGLGISSPWICIAMVLSLAAGVRTWWRRDATFVAYVALIVTGSALAVAQSHPAWVQHPGTFARYMQPAVPFMLLFVAEGFAGLAKPLTAVLQVTLALASVAVLFAAGPMPAYLYNPNQFMGHPWFQFDYDPAHNAYRIQLPDGPIPEFYRRLAALPPRSLTLVEAPWSLETDHDPQPLYQKIHGQYVRIGLLTPLCAAPAYGEYPEADTGMRLTRFVHLPALLRGDTHDADFLVMHLKSWPPTLPATAEWPDLSTCLPQIEQHFGAPVYHDAEIEVFALSAAARALSAAKN